MFASTVHAQSSKKTLTLPNGEVIWNLNGEWDVLVENYGSWSFAGSYRQLVKVTQKDSAFVGIRMLDDPYNPKGAEQIRGELDKNGIKTIQIISAQGPLVSVGTISDDGNKMAFDSADKSRLIYTRK